MSLNNIKVAPGFMRYMPKEYQDLVEKGPFGKKIKLPDIGTFKEILEEHPMCEGCAMAYFIRLALIGLPNPEHTIIVGTASCSRLALTQAAVPFVYGNYCDTNGVATGLKRGLQIRFPDQKKDIIVMAGDGGISDIGFAQVMHSWFRREKFTTIMLDNEVYGNTGGQESGMTCKDAVVKMAPLGKKFDKIDMIGLAKAAGVDYIARLAPTNPNRIINTVRKAVLVARDIGSTYIQAYTSCNIEYSIPPDKVFDDARKVEEERYGFIEIISEQAKELLDKSDLIKK